MKSHLSHILPVWKACEILGHPTVYRIASSYIRLKESTNVRPGSHPNDARPIQTTTASEEDIRTLCNALGYQPMDSNTTSLDVSILDNTTLPDSVLNAWRKWLTHPQLIIENKNMFVQFVVPATVQPHTGSSGHMGLFDCWIYSLQGHAAQNVNPANTISNNSYYTSSNQQSAASSGASTSSGGHSPTIWIPDILILFAVTKDYRDFRVRQNHKIIQYRRRKQQQRQQQLQKQQQQLSQQDNDDDKIDSSTMNDNDDTIPDDNNDATVLELSPSDQKIVWTMATLCYRIYDSYQKKGMVQRDTIHRFLTDVHGEDSYKQPKNKALLDTIFYMPKNEMVGNNYLQVTISEQQFCKRVLDTIKIDDIHATHLLLDWISLLACAMIPPAAIQDSVAMYLENLQKFAYETKTPNICQLYQLADNRLYEIKRRFHSMVAKSTATSMSVIMGHPMTSTTTTSTTTTTNNASTPSSSDGALERTTSGSMTNSGHSKVISNQYFIQALSSGNEELGTGGYLPSSLAKLVFHAGCNTLGSSSSSFSMSNNNLQHMGSNVSDLATTLDDNNDSNQFYPVGWGLQNVLQFGCMAVRHDSSKPQDPDVPLLRFLFNMFQFAAPHMYTDDDPVANKNVLTRSQVTKMVQLLAEYAVFRRRADHSPKDFGDDDDDDDFAHVDDMSDAANSFDNADPSPSEALTMVDMAACLLLGLIPSNYKPLSTTEDSTSTNKNNHSKTKKSKRAKVPLKVLVDYALDGNTAMKDQMTFDEFTTWHTTKMTETGPRTRLGPLMTELRLIAAVQFGIPPVLASMEITLIAEIERRHKLRYPQTELSRRGPRGTVWYIIDALWFTSWANLVKKTAGSPLDNQDGRGGISNSDRSRTLNRIRNASLLVDNGSLALRPDIRWKHDYEILPPLAWSALQAWYDGGPPIFRSVVKYVSNATQASPHSSKASTPRGMIPTENEIELYPLFVTVYLCDAASRGEAKPFQQNFQLSRVSPILVMLVQLSRELDVNPDQARLWVMGNKGKNDLLDHTGVSSSPSPGSPGDDSHTGKGFGSDDWILGLDQSIIEQIKRRGATSLNKDSPITLLLELKDRDSGLWPRGVDGKEWAFRREKNGGTTSPSSSSLHAGSGTTPSDLGDGIVGLYNMGNTCYLNSSVQCLSHTPIFREYFTSKAYLNDINTTNPLGHEGRLAQVTAVLINSLWKRFNIQSNDPTHNHKRITAPGSYALVTAPALTPKTFKESLSKFNEHFHGNEQHDAQELLAFLLGGLSEDLNRIVDKPYIEAPDSDGRPDSELADIWWSNHLKREMSIIVALFTGQYKSLLTCRTCKYESARFEPFSFLQVPLPEDDNLTVTLILYPIKDNTCAMKYCVRVRNDGKLRDVLIALAKVLHNDDMEGNHDNENNAGAASDGDDTNSKSGGGSGDDDTDTEASNKNESIYMQRAQNLAVVDMRDGYISKIAPNSWLLQDLQNKETGELPLLHVFELDSSPEGDTPDLVKSVSKDVEETGSDVIPSEDDEIKKIEFVKPKQAYLAIAQRRSELMSTDYLHPLVHRVFGTPLLLRVHDLDNCTGRDLYDLVAKRLRNVVSKSVHRFLIPQAKDAIVKSDTIGDENPEPAASTSLAVHDDENKALQDVCTSVFRTLTDMEDVSAGPVPRYGFRLRITSREGRRCLSCPWYECCIGCLVPDDDKPTVVMDGDSAVVDWHFAIDVATNGFGLRSNAGDFGQPTNSRRNAATVTIKNHVSCGTGVNKTSILQQPGAVTLEECLDAFAKEEKIPEAYCSKCKDFRVQTKRMSLWRLPPVMIIHLKRFQFTQHMRRKLRDLVVFPIEGLDLSRIMAPASDAAASKKERTETKHVDGKDGAVNGELKDDGRSEMLYDLYGVVHHQGALSGGHYVASLKSELDGQFRLFNDAQIYEIHSRDVVDSSAYILFYIRRDVAKAKLSDFWDVREGGNGLSEEDMDQLLKGRSDRCVIS